MIDADDLPEGWALATLGEVTEPKVRQGEPSDTSAEFTYIDITAVDNVQKTIAEPKTLPVKGAPSRARQHVRPGDVLVSMTRPNLNAVAVVPDRLAGSIASTGFHVLRPKEVLPEWLFTIVRSVTFVTAMSELVQGALYPAVRPSDIRDFAIPVPPLAEQRRIMAKIEELTARSCAARAALVDVPTLLEQFRQSVLASAFRGDLTADWRAKHPNTEPASALLARIRDERRKQWEAKFPKKAYAEPAPVDENELPELPEGWCWTTIEESCSAIVDCPHSTPAWTATGRICVRTTEFRPGVLDLQDARFVSEATFQERISRLVPQEGDVLYSREGGILGIAVMIPPQVELCLGQRMMLLRADRRGSAALLMHWLNSPDVLDRVSGLTTGSASPHLNVGDVKRFPIPLIPSDEQSQIVAQINCSDARRSLVMEAVADAERQLQHLDQSILAKAFCGELVPQDPSDEPATTLLARIRSGGSGTTPTTPTRSAMRGQVKFYILLLLRTWNKPLGREMLERGLVLLLNADVRRTIIGRSKPTKRTKKLGTPPQFVVGMDALLGEMLDDGQLVPESEAGFFAEGKHGIDFTAAPAADLDAVRETAEAMKVLHKDRQQATDADIVSALHGEIYELVP